MVDEQHQERSRNKTKQFMIPSRAASNLADDTAVQRYPWETQELPVYTPLRGLFMHICVCTYNKYSVYLVRTVYARAGMLNF